MHVFWELYSINVHFLQRILLLLLPLFSHCPQCINKEYFYRLRNLCFFSGKINNTNKDMA